MVEITIGFEFCGDKKDIEFHELIKGKQEVTFKHKEFKTDDGFKMFIADKIHGIYSASVPSWRSGSKHIASIGIKFTVAVNGIGIPTYKGIYAPNPIWMI